MFSLEPYLPVYPVASPQVKFDCSCIFWTLVSFCLMEAQFSMFILYFVSLVKIIFTFCRFKSLGYFCSSAFGFNCLGVAH